MKKLLMMLTGLVFLIGTANPAWAPLVTKVDEPKPKPKSGGDPNVVDLSDKKGPLVPQIPSTPPPPKKENQSPKKK